MFYYNKRKVPAKVRGGVQAKACGCGSNVGWELPPFDSKPSPFGQFPISSESRLELAPLGTHESLKVRPQLIHSVSPSAQKREECSPPRSDTLF